MTGAFLLVPILWPLAGAVLVYLVSKKNERAQDYLANFITLSELAIAVAIWVISLKGVTLELEIPYIAGLGLTLSADEFSALYVVVTAVLWAMTSLMGVEYFGKEKERNRYYLFAILTLGMTVGVFLSNDLFTTLMFFEMMSFTSYVIVAQEETKEALHSAKLYLSIAVFGGMMTLLGLMMLYATVGTVRIPELYTACIASGQQNVVRTAGVLTVIGFAAKAGAFPLHIWLPQAHANAPAPASALLSGVLTKTGVFGLIIVSTRVLISWDGWSNILLLLGVITFLLGAILAVFSINLKRTLACSSVSQIGFIITGIAMLTFGLRDDAYIEVLVIAAYGVILYMINHSLVKLDLFMVAGMIYHNEHSLDLNDLRGFGRNKPLLHVLFLIGAFSLMGIPGTVGFLSKSLIHESVMSIVVVEKLFLIGSGLTAAYLMKLYIAIFVEKNVDASKQKQMDDKKKGYMTLLTKIAISVSAALIVVVGTYPARARDALLAEMSEFVANDSLVEFLRILEWENIKGILISFTIGVIIYIFVVRLFLMKKKRVKGAKKPTFRERIFSNDPIYVNRWPAVLDLEKSVYVPVISGVCFVGRLIARVLDCMLDTIIVFLRKTVYRDVEVDYDLLEGNSVTRTIGRILNYLQDKRISIIYKRALRETGNTADINIVRKDYEHTLALRYTENRESRLVIFRTLSFGLMLFCVGFMLTAIYLLIIHSR